LTLELCQIVAYELFFYLTYFLEVGKTQDLPSKIWQTLGDAPQVDSHLSYAVWSWNARQTPAVWRVYSAFLPKTWFQTGPMGHHGDQITKHSAAN
jgi:hypothetical protein